jgi:hypothetical protein
MPLPYLAVKNLPAALLSRPIVLTIAITTFLIAADLRMPTPAMALSQTTPRAASKTVTWDDSPNCGHFYLDGKQYKSILVPNAQVTVAVYDTGKYIRAEIRVKNNGSAPLDLLPSDFHISEIEPKKKELAYQPPDKIVRSLSRSVAWSNAFTGMAANHARQQVTTESNTDGNANAYGSNGSSAAADFNAQTRSTTYVPNYAAQQRANQQIAANNGALAAVVDDLNANVLRATTISPGQSIAGRMYFRREKHAKSLLLTAVVGDSHVEFPFDLY